MASIPRIEPGGAQLTTEVGVAKQDPNLESTTGQMFVEAGQLTKEVADTLYKAHAEIEKTAMENAGKLVIDSAMLDMEQNPKFSDEQKAEYISRMKEGVEAASRKGSIPAARAAFLADANTEIEIAGLKISKEYNKRMKDQYAADRATAIDGYGKGYATTALDDTKGREHFLLKAQAKLYNSADAGLMTKKQATTEYLKFVKQSNERLMDYQAIVNPEGTIAELKKPDGGFFSAVNKEARAKGLEKAMTHAAKTENVRNEVISKTQNIRADSFASQLSAGNLEMDKLDEARANNHITPEDYKTMYDNISSKISDTAGTNHEAMYKLESDILGQIKEGELTKDKGLDWPDTRRAIIQANTDGKISKNDMTKLLEYHLMPQKEMMKKLGEDINQPNNAQFLKQENEKKGAFIRNQEATNTVFKLFKDYTGDNKREVGHLYVDYMDYIKKNNVTPDKYVEVGHMIAFKDMLIKHPEISSFPKEGKLVGKYRYYPDKYPVLEK